MANLVIIPARGGSKRIHKKNIKDFNGHPIISYVIQSVKKTNLFDEIMVSTDDLSISKIAVKYGATVPFLRSDKNADDFANLADVLLEVLQRYKVIGKTFKNICCILPTAALISNIKITDAFNKLNKHKFSSVVPVIKFAYPIQRALSVNNGLLALKDLQHINTRSQDLKDYYHDSGQFYWLNTKSFLKEKKIFMSNTGYIELKEYEAQDVDNEEDWEMLEIKYKYKK